MSIIHDENDDNLYSRGASFTDQVSFDNYSLLLRGQRIFLQSVSSIRLDSNADDYAVPGNSTHFGYLSRPYGLTSCKRSRHQV